MHEPKRCLIRRELSSLVLGVIAVTGSACTGGIFDAGGTGELGGDGGDGGSGGPAGSATSGAGTSADPESSADDSSGDGPGPGGEVPPAGDGYFSCPTVDPPAYLLGTSFPELSEPFGTSCAGCHGPSGAGLPLIPPIPGGLTADQFREVVRTGRGTMPAFPESFISDAELDSDFEGLLALASDDQLPPNEWSWSAEEVERARAEGLEAWRRPDDHGVACANCHSPDGLDLAMIGYPDAAILRRAAEHVSPDDAAALVKFVHAQRRHFEISSPCSTDWRPFQPGGMPLPGDTPEARDRAFGEQLFDRELLITGTVETLEDAQAVMDQMVSTNLRTLPIGINLPRWTEDRFNGDAHASVNDYLAPLGTPPTDPEGWYAQEDEYLADPTDARLFELLEQLPQSTDHAGYVETHANSGICGLPNYLVEINLDKRRSLLLAQHLFRRAVGGDDAWSQMGPMPFVEHAERYQDVLSPFFEFGNSHIEPVCYHDYEAHAAILESLPDGMTAELPEPRNYNDDHPYARNVVVGMHETLAHPWMTLGQIYDQTLHLGKIHGLAHNKVHYWHTRNFPHHSGFHEPFLALHRILSQEHFYRTQVDELSLAKRIATSPMLHGTYAFLDEPVRSLTPGTMDQDDERLPRSVRVRLNFIRTVALLQRDLLESGAMIYDLDQLNQAPDAFRGYIESLQRELDRGTIEAVRQELGGDLDLFTAQTLALVDEVHALMTTAAVAPSSYR